MYSREKKEELLAQLLEYQIALQKRQEPAVMRVCGLILCKLGRMGEASDYYQRALASNPHDAEAHAGYGFVLYQMGRPQEALERFKESLNFRPKDAVTLNNYEVVRDELLNKQCIDPKLWRLLPDLVYPEQIADGEFEKGLKYFSQDLRYSLRAVSNDASLMMSLTLEVTGGDLPLEAIHAVLYAVERNTHLKTLHLKFDCCHASAVLREGLGQRNFTLIGGVPEEIAARNRMIIEIKSGLLGGINDFFDSKIKSTLQRIICNHAEYEVVPYNVIGHDVFRNIRFGSSSFSWSFSHLTFRTAKAIAFAFKHNTTYSSLKVSFDKGYWFNRFDQQEVDAHFDFCRSFSFLELFIHEHNYALQKWPTLKPNAFMIRNQKIVEDLIRAVAVGDFQAVKRLVERGANCWIHAPKLLNLAFTCEVYEYLAKVLVDINSRVEQVLALPTHLIERDGQPCFIDSTMQRYRAEHPDLLNKPTQMTLLLCAAFQGDITLVKHALRQGAFLLERDYEGYNAFLMAVKKTQLPLVLWFLDHYPIQSWCQRYRDGDRDPTQFDFLEAKNIRQENALAIAARYGHKALLRQLLAYGISAGIGIGEDFTTISLERVDVSGLMFIGSTMRYVGTLFRNWYRASSANEGIIFEYRLMTQDILAQMGARNADKAITNFAEWLKAIEGGYACGDVEKILQYLNDLRLELGEMQSPRYARYQQLRDRQNFFLELSRYREGEHYYTALLAARPAPQLNPHDALNAEQQAQYFRRAIYHVSRDQKDDLKILITRIAPGLDIDQDREISALLTAFQYSARGCLPFLCLRGVNKHWRDDVDNSILHRIASCAEHLSFFIELLIGSEVCRSHYLHLLNQCNQYGETFLHELAKKFDGTPEQLRMLFLNIRMLLIELDGLSDIPALKNNVSETALHVAVRCKQPEFIRVFAEIFELYQVGYALNLQVLAPYCRNLVSLAVKFFDKKTFDMLEAVLPLQVMVDERTHRIWEIDPLGVNHADATGRMPVHWAAQSEYADEILLRLFYLGAMFDVQDNRGRTFLHYLVEHNDSAVALKAAKIVMPHLPNDVITRRDNEGISPFLALTNRVNAIEFIRFFWQQAVYALPIDVLPSCVTSRLKSICSRIQYLIFQGGGPKGIAYVGALQKIIEYGVTLEQIRGVAGTSAGAIAALLLALGYTPEELKELLTNLSVEQFLDDETRRQRLFRLKVNYLYFHVYHLNY